ncbi:hypothetical protein Tco_1142469 [Tanacetum coccineum]
MGNGSDVITGDDGFAVQQGLRCQLNSKFVNNMLPGGVDSSHESNLTVRSEIIAGKEVFDRIKLDESLSNTLALLTRIYNSTSSSQTKLIKSLSFVFARAMLWFKTGIVVVRDSRCRGKKSTMRLIKEAPFQRYNCQEEMGFVL